MQSPTEPPLQSAWWMELSAMTVEYEQFIYYLQLYSSVENTNNITDSILKYETTWYMKTDAESN